jgi:PEGA domain-containing protein
MRRSIRCAVAASALVLGSPCAAVAQEPSSAPGQEATDEELIAKGVTLRKLGRDAEALAAFERAEAFRPSARAVAQIALAHQALAQWREAERGLAEALRDSDDGWVSRQRAHLEYSLAVVQDHLAWLEVESNVAGAEVWIGGEFFARLPIDRPMRTTVGELTVELRAPGYAPIQRTLHIEAGSQVHAAFTFVVQPSALARPSEDKSTVRMDALRPASGTRTAGWITLASAGGLLLTGIAGVVTRQWEARIYNDDSLCAPVVGAATRSERCGTNRDIGSAAQTIAIAAFVGSGIAGMVSGVLLVGRPGPAPAPAPTAGRIGCAVAGIGVGCSGVF